MSSELLHVTSPDGSIVGVERLGDGPPLLAVHGTTADRSRWAPVRDGLAERFSLHLLDRRGRGSSRREAEGGYSIEREVADVLAVLALIDAPTFYLGHSYGATVGLSVLARTQQVRRAFLYEPPMDAGGLEVVPAAFRAKYAALIEAGRRDDALDSFYREVIGVDPTPLHGLPVWQARKAAAHTLVREGDAVAAYEVDAQALAEVTTPTLVLQGPESPPVFGAAARLVADALPSARIVHAAGQGHTMIDADPRAFVALVCDFFLDTRA